MPKPREQTKGGIHVLVHPRLAPPAGLRAHSTLMGTHACMHRCMHVQGSMKATVWASRFPRMRIVDKPLQLLVMVGMT